MTDRDLSIYRSPGATSSSRSWVMTRRRHSYAILAPALWAQTLSMRTARFRRSMLEFKRGNRVDHPLACRYAASVNTSTSPALTWTPALARDVRMERMGARNRADGGMGVFWSARDRASGVRHLTRTPAPENVPCAERVRSAPATALDRCSGEIPSTLWRVPEHSHGR